VIGLILWLAFFSAGCSSTNHTAQCDQLLAQAQNAVSKRDYEKAQRLLQLAAEEAEKSDKLFHVPDVLKEQANLSFRQGKFDDAVAYAHKLLATYDEMMAKDQQRSGRQQIMEDRTRVSILLADCLIKEDRKEEALQILKKASDDLKDIGGDIILQAIITQRYHNLLNELHQINLGDDVDAVGGHYEVRSTFLKAHALFERREFKAAIPAYKKCQVVSESSSERSYYVQSAIELATCELVTGAIQDARQNAQLAVAKMDAFAAHRDVKSKALVTLAVTTPAPDRARDLINQAAEVDLTAAVGQLSQLSMLINYADANPSLNEKIGLLQWDWLQRKRSVFLAHLIIRNLASAFLEQQKYEAGIKFFEQQRKSQVWLTDIDRADCLDAEAAIMEAMGHNSESKERRLAALKIRSTIAPKDDWSKFTNIAGLMADYSHVGQTKESISLGLAALKDPLISDRSAVVPKAEIEFALARNYRDMHEFEKSLARYDSLMESVKKYRVFSLAKVEKERNQVSELLKKQTATKAK
jgi:tetratricopeptide (TPR) repeat protein